jgi:hypothetical protein
MSFIIHTGIFPDFINKLSKGTYEDPRQNFTIEEEIQLLEKAMILLKQGANFLRK